MTLRKFLQQTCKESRKAWIKYFSDGQSIIIFQWEKLHIAEYDVEGKYLQTSFSSGEKLPPRLEYLLEEEGSINKQVKKCFIDLWKKEESLKPYLNADVKGYLLEDLENKLAENIFSEDK